MAEIQDFDPGHSVVHFRIFHPFLLVSFIIGGAKDFGSGEGRDDKTRLA
jgi:hypothetical protein